MRHNILSQAVNVLVAVGPVLFHTTSANTVKKLSHLALSILGICVIQAAVRVAYIGLDIFGHGYMGFVRQVATVASDT